MPVERAGTLSPMPIGDDQERAARRAGRASRSHERQCGQAGGEKDHAAGDDGAGADACGEGDAAPADEDHGDRQRKDRQAGDQRRVALGVLQILGVDEEQREQTEEHGGHADRAGAQFGDGEDAWVEQRVLGCVARER